MLQKIAIKMLGDFSVVADGRCVVDATAKLTKPWQLFCYLALNREHVTPSSVLLQELPLVQVQLPSELLLQLELLRFRSLLQ